jgi:hypothetical protein
VGIALAERLSHPPYVTMLHRLLAFAIFMSITIWACAQTAPTTVTGYITPLRPLLQALDRSGVSGSLVFSGHCPGFPGDIPHLRVPSSSEGSLLQLARETFSDDPSMRVSQDSDGTIRINESGTSTELLDVKISHVSFEKNGVPLRYAIYSPGHALYYVILNAPEVLGFAKAHDIQIPFVGTIGSQSGSQIPVDLPHVSGSMDNLTLSQALDQLAKTFPGIWVYENCPAGDGKGRVVAFWFFSLQNPGFFPQ